MKSRKSRSSRIREKAVTVLQAWTRGFVTRRKLKRAGIVRDWTGKWEERVCARWGKERNAGIAAACIEVYDTFGLETWDVLVRPTQRSSIVVYEEPIEFSSKRPPLLDYEEDDSRHFVYYDELNRSNTRVRSRATNGSTPHRVRKHSPYESAWNMRVLQDFYNVRAPVGTAIVKKTTSRLMLDTASTPLTRIQHRIKRSHSTSTKNSSDEVERRFRRVGSKPLNSLDCNPPARLRYSTPKQRASPSKRRVNLSSAS